MKAHRTGAICAVWFLALSGGIYGQSPPSLAVAPPNLTFPSTPVGWQAAPLAVSVRNPTNTPIQLQLIVISGIDFLATHNCGKELAPGAACAVQIVFKPAIPGDRMGSLEIVATGSNAPLFVALSGTGQ